MAFTRINYNSKYLNPKKMVEGKVYTVTNNLLDVLKIKVNSTWIERNYESEFNWENHFTDVYPFVNKYK